MTIAHFTNARPFNIGLIIEDTFRMMRNLAKDNLYLVMVKSMLATFLMIWFMAMVCSIKPMAL